MRLIHYIAGGCQFFNMHGISCCDACLTSSGAENNKVKVIAKRWVGGHQRFSTKLSRDKQRRALPQRELPNIAVSAMITLA